MTHHHPYIPVDNGFIPGRSSLHPVQFAGKIGHIAVQLRGKKHTGGSESTRAYLRALVILAELQKELGQIGSRNILTPRLLLLHKELIFALQTVGP